MKPLKPVLLKNIQLTNNHSITDVLDHMEFLEEFFGKHKQYHAFAPFLHVYKRVTQTVYERLDDFEDPSKLIELDISFANLYFDAMTRFFRTGEKIAPWKTYLTYVTRDKTTPFVSVLLGINAHINSDLLTAIHEINYSNEHDFFLVNEILEHLTPEIMKYLALKEHDIFGLAGLIFKQFTIYEFRKTIQTWRNHCWQNKNLLLKSIFTNQKNKYHLDTELLGRKLINDFDNLLHFHNITGSLHHLNASHVNLEY